MGDIRWYKRDPDAALSGMSDLTLEEKGAYNTVLDLIYAREGNLPDDPRFISGWLRCDVRVWKRIRQRLMDLGKLYVHAGNLRNRRADREIDAAQHRLASAAQAGLTSAANRKLARSIFNDIGSTAVERTLQLPTPRKNNTTSLSEYVDRAAFRGRK